MVTTLEHYKLVRVKQLLQIPFNYDGWRVNKRPPKVGDWGTLVDILQADGCPDRFVVECCETNGTTVWLADFNRDELESHGEVRIANMAHLLFLRSGRLLLVKRPDADWRQLQDEYADYMTSLGPWTDEEIATYFTDDYTEDDSRWPFSRQAINEYFASSNVVELSSE